MNELRRSLQVANDEIALVKRSASTFQCSLCPNKYQARLSITDAGLLLDLDDDLLISFSVILEFLRFAGFLWHSDEKWSPSLR